MITALNKVLKMWRVNIKTIMVSPYGNNIEIVIGGTIRNKNRQD